MLFRNRAFKMASWANKCSWALCVFVIFSVLVLNCDSKGARGGSRGGFRSSYRSTRIRQRVSTTYVSRARYGTGGFSGSTWKAAAIAGLIYGGPRYLRTPYHMRYPDRMPPICSNNFDRDSTGRVYGYFICPREHEPDNNTWCCGADNNEFCCDEFYYQRLESPRNDSSTTYIVVAVVVIIFISIVIAAVCYKRKKKKGFIISKKKGKSYTISAEGHLSVPLNSPPPEESKSGNLYENQANPGVAPAVYPSATYNGYLGQPDGSYPNMPSAAPYPAQPDAMPYPPHTGPYPAPAGPYPPSALPGYPPAECAMQYPPADGGLPNPAHPQLPTGPPPSYNDAASDGYGAPAPGFVQPPGYPPYQSGPMA